jgi:PAS domain-containing protein
MASLVPAADSIAGRLLQRLGRLLGLRSETVYSRTMLVVVLVQFIVLGLAVVLVWLAVTAQFRRADDQELLSSARRVQSYFAAQPGVASRLLAPRAAELTGRRVYVQSSPDGEKWSGVRIAGNRGRVPDAVFRVAEDGVVREVVVAGTVSFYETGLMAARTFVVGLALAGGLMLLVMLFVVDRTIVGRIQLLADKVEGEKDAERLPVKLDYPGDDELAMLARSIEELAVLVQQAEREYRHVVEDQTESICRFDRDWRITFSNRSFEALCSLPPVGRKAALEACLAADTFRVIRETVGGLGPERPVAWFTNAVLKHGTATTWYRSTVRANFDSKGGFTGGQWIAADVTSEVLARKKLQESEKQLALLSGRLMHLQDEERRRIARDQSSHRGGNAGHQPAGLPGTAQYLLPAASAAARGERAPFRHPLVHRRVHQAEQHSRLSRLAGGLSAVALGRGNGAFPHRAGSAEQHLPSCGRDQGVDHAAARRRRRGLAGSAGQRRGVAERLFLGAVFGSRVGWYARADEAVRRNAGGGFVAVWGLGEVPARCHGQT